MFLVFIDNLKKYWWILLIIGGIIFHQVKVYNLEKILNESIESRDKQISVIKENREKELKEKDLIIEKHKEDLANIEIIYKQQSEELQRERNRKIQVIVKYYDDPEKISAKIIEVYGFKYVK